MVDADLTGLTAIAQAVRGRAVASAQGAVVAGRLGRVGLTEVVEALLRVRAVIRCVAEAEQAATLRVGATGGSGVRGARVRAPAVDAAGTGRAEGGFADRTVGITRLLRVVGCALAVAREGVALIEGQVALLCVHAVAAASRFAVLLAELQFATEIDDVAGLRRVVAVGVAADDALAIADASASRAERCIGPGFADDLAVLGITFIVNVELRRQVLVDLRNVRQLRVIAAVVDQLQLGAAER